MSFVERSNSLIGVQMCGCHFFLLIILHLFSECCISYVIPC